MTSKKQSERHFFYAVTAAYCAAVGVALGYEHRWVLVALFALIVFACLFPLLWAAGAPS